MSSGPHASRGANRATRRTASRCPFPAAVLLLGISATGTTLARGQSLCDLVFKDVAERAPVIVLAEYEKPKGEDPYLKVLESVKGDSDREILALGPHGLRVYDPVPGDQFLLALTVDHTLVRTVGGMGFCSPISVLAIRGGKLRSRDRAAYDGQRKTMTLDQLRAELVGPTETVAPGGSTLRPDRSFATGSEEFSTGKP